MVRLLTQQTREIFGLELELFWIGASILLSNPIYKVVDEHAGDGDF